MSTFASTPARRGQIANRTGDAFSALAAAAEKLEAALDVAGAIDSPHRAALARLLLTVNDACVDCQVIETAARGQIVSGP